MGKFIINKKTNREFYFSLKAGNGQTILTSERYTTKASSENGILSVRLNAKDYNNYEKKTSLNGEHYFVLKAGNGQVIGMSEMFESEAGRDNCIESIKTNAPFALVTDLTI